MKLKYKLIHLFVLMTIIAIGLLLLKEYRHKRHVRNVEAFWAEAADIQSEVNANNNEYYLVRKKAFDDRLRRLRSNYNKSATTLGKEETKQIRDRIIESRLGYIY